MVKQHVWIVGVCFRGMLRGMFRGMFQGNLRGMSRGMFRCMFPRTSLLTKGMLWGYVSGHVSRYVSGVEHASFHEFLTPKPKQWKLPYQPGRRQCGASIMKGSRNIFYSNRVRLTSCKRKLPSSSCFYILHCPLRHLELADNAKRTTLFKRIWHHEN